MENVDGKNFEIRKVCDKSLSDATRNSIREFCTVSEYFSLHPFMGLGKPA